MREHPVQSYMDREGLNAPELARKSGLSRQGLRFLLHGDREPKASTLWRLHEATGVSIEAIVRWHVDSAA